MSRHCGWKPDDIRDPKEGARYALWLTKIDTQESSRWLDLDCAAAATQHQLLDETLSTLKREAIARHVLADAMIDDAVLDAEDAALRLALSEFVDRELGDVFDRR